MTVRKESFARIFRTSMRLTFAVLALFDQAHASHREKNTSMFEEA